MNSMSRRMFVPALWFMAVGLASAARAQGNPPAATSATLFQNVRIFDGRGASLSAPSNVLIKGNIIERISTEPIAPEPGMTVIAGNGRTLMPGLIDAHWHAMLIRPNPAQSIVNVRGTTRLTSASMGEVLNHACDLVNECNSDFSPISVVCRAINRPYVRWRKKQLLRTQMVCNTSAPRDERNIGSLPT